VDGGWWMVDGMGDGEWWMGNGEWGMGKVFFSAFFAVGRGGDADRDRE